MGALKKYDPKNVTISFDGIILNEGIVDGTFVTASRSSRNSSLNVGADSGGTMVINHDKSATITLVLRKGSATNDLLTAVVQSDEAVPDTKRVGEFVIEDFSGRTKLHADEAFLDGPPDDEFGNDESDVTWTFMALNMAMDVKGSGDAANSLVGVGNT